MKKILIVPDISGWVMESIANGVVSALKHKFDFTIKYSDKLAADQGKKIIDWDADLDKYDVIYIMLSGYLKKGLKDYSKIVTSFHGGPGSESQANVLQRKKLEKIIRMSYVSEQTKKRLTVIPFKGSKRININDSIGKISKSLCLRKDDELKIIPLDNIETQAKAVFTKHGFGISKLYFTPYGVPTDFYKQERIESDFVCGYAGWIQYVMDAQKDHRRGHWILDAHKKLGFKLSIAGGLSKIGGGVERISEFRKNHSDIKVGLYDHNKMVDYYKGISCYLVPDKLAGGPMPVLEAGAMGIPVICTDAGHCGDFIEDGEHGIIVKSYNEFVDAINWMATHPRERGDMGKNLQSYIRKNRTWEAVSQYWEKFFNA